MVFNSLHFIPLHLVGKCINVSNCSDQSEKNITSQMRHPCENINIKFFSFPLKLIKKKVNRKKNNVNFGTMKKKISRK